VRVVAIRMAINLRAQEGPQAFQAQDDLLARAVADAVEPELAVAQGRYRPLLERALADALVGLDERDKAVLRLQVVDGLTLDQMSLVLRVHRATVARWLVRVRGVLLKQVCRRLSIDIGSSPSESRSLIEAVRDDLQLRLSRLLPAVPRGAGSTEHGGGAR
jgi:RNA polymerase sigma-70 factor (ECF subfamily)